MDAFLLSMYEDISDSNLLEMMRVLKAAWYCQLVALTQCGRSICDVRSG